MKKLTDIQQFIQALATSDNLFVVEGKKDVAALKELGAKDVMAIHKSIFETVEAAVDTGKTVSILTDLDPKGRQLYGKLASGLAGLGVKIDDRFRDFLAKETALRQIEGLVSYINSHSL